MDYNSILTLLMPCYLGYLREEKQRKKICISCARQAQDPQVQPTAERQDQALQTPGGQGQGQMTRGQPPSQQSPSAPVTKTAQPPTGRTQVYSVQQPTSPITQQVVQRPA